MDFDADPDWEWRTGALDSPENVYAVWRDAAELSREFVAEVRVSVAPQRRDPEAGVIQVGN